MKSSTLIHSITKQQAYYLINCNYIGDFSKINYIRSMCESFLAVGYNQIRYFASITILLQMNRIMAFFENTITIEFLHQFL